MWQRQHPLAIWAAVSLVCMLIGAFGSWVSVLGASVSGTDGSNDGWIVVGACVVAGAALVRYLQAPRRSAAIGVSLAGAVGAAVTIWDRVDISNRIEDAGEFAGALARVGWGLNLALAGSVSLALAGVALFNTRPREFMAATQSKSFMYRECPYCKEEMRRDATVCPHCRLETAAWELSPDGYWWRPNTVGVLEWLDESTGTWRPIELPRSPSQAVPAKPFGERAKRRNVKRYWFVLSILVLLVGGGAYTAAVALRDERPVGSFNENGRAMYHDDNGNDCSYGEAANNGFDCP